MKTPVKNFTLLMTAMLFFFSISLIAQDQPAATPDLPAQTIPKAKIEFEQNTYDFGMIDEGTFVSQVFVFTNTSEEPLILTDAKGSCGCTVPRWPREPIMPGETASITVEFNSTGKKGKRMQRITLTANTEPAQTFLSLSGEVRPRDANNTDSFYRPESKAEVEMSADCFAIFPNPTAEILKLKVEEQNLGQSAMISIYAKTGQLMAKREVKSIDGTIEFNVAHYPAGTYIANVQIGERKPEARCFVVVD